MLSYERLARYRITPWTPRDDDRVHDQHPFTATPMNPSPSSPVKRPTLTLLSVEPWRAAYEFLSHKLMHEPLAASGDGHPVLIFPGLGADGRSVAPLRKVCESLGYAAFDWGRGFNTGPQGDVDDWLRDLAAHSTELLKNHQQTVTLIGWSLGGIYARELAKLMQGRVRQVITIGTPFNADADHTNVGWLYGLLTASTPAFDQDFSRRLRTAPPVPTTSIYSRSDGVVAWQSCCHRTHRAGVQDIEIHGSHIGMGWNPSVLRVVADRLAQRPGAWQPYAPNPVAHDPTTHFLRTQDDATTTT
jgi:pimeloyl-ACP methyl ester carboxylesterase